MSNKSLEAMELAFNNLSSIAKRLIVAPKGEGIFGRNIINLENNFSIDNALALIGNAKHIGIINAEKFNTQSITEIINILTTKHKATVIRVSLDPVSCNVFYPTSEVGFKHTIGSYEYSYGQKFNYGKWETIIAQKGFGVRLMDYSKTDYVSPLSMIRGQPVTNMDWLFYNCYAPTLNLIDWDTSNVTSMGSMFYGCESIIINGLSNFDTSNVTNMSAMFAETQFAETKITNLDLSNFNTSNVTTMCGMFRCNEFTNLNLRSFDISNVIDMSHMFERSLAVNLDLSGFDTDNVTDMDNMFRESNCKTLIARTQTSANRYQASGDFPANVTVTIQ